MSRARWVRVLLLLGVVSGASSAVEASPKWTVQLDPLTTALGFVHVQVERAIGEEWSVYAGPSLKLFPGLLAEEGEAPYTGLGVELGVRWYFHGAAPEGGWVLLRGVMARLRLDDAPNTTAFGGYVSALAGYTAIVDGWFVVSGGLGVQYLAYRVAGNGPSGLLPAAHTTVGVAF